MKRPKIQSLQSLRQFVAEGRASGEPVDGETELKRLRAKYAAMAENKPR